MRDNESLDPADWSDLRALGHRMMDDMFDHLANLREGPVWRPMPDASRQQLRRALPREPTPAGSVYQQFQRLVQPYATGNLHPRFMGWVHGGGNPVGMLAELLAGGLNANLGGRDHAPIEIERQVIAWSAEMLGFPASASGVLVTGTSIANLIGVLVARSASLGPSVRHRGVADAGLVAYTSAAAHGCLPRAMEMAGLGREALRMIPCDDQGRMRRDALARRVAEDRAKGMSPFLLVGTAGTVDIGAIDDLDALADFAAEQSLWFHVDGAFGAIAALAPKLRPLLAGIERADSVAFDFHKWAQVPYDAGCILVRDGSRQLETFGAEAAYLRREQRGLAGGGVWPCDLGPDLSRGFRALKVWMTLSVYGADRIGSIAQQTCDLAAAMAAMIDREPALRRLAPVALNIVCFRYIAAEGDLDRLNADIVADLQESGIAAPSTTIVDGALAIRAAIVNHRTNHADLTITIDAILRAGHARATAAKKMPPAIHRGQGYREASRLGDAGTKGPFPATSAETLAAVLP
ncbi:pyridoxal phosphate-dependent decarboxylase family protein [Rhodopila sp.]|uniref:pyridoxal phosphate-dependent decarboxylase family protein n=1 Tax=Rhodopila sp. TaxID=2480087 RepID=UPI003D0A1D94